MAELLVFTATQSLHGDPEIARGQYLPGQVISIEADGHPWAPGDAAGHARIIRLPGIDPRNLVDLLSPSAPREGEHQRHRVWYLPEYAALADRIEGMSARAFKDRYAVRLAPIRKAPSKFVVG
jgi:hypothetical protein